MSARAKASIKEINLKGQGTAVVVGGTKGIGAGIARRFITLGLKRLILVGRDETAAKALINTLDRLYPEQSTEVLFVTGDVSHVRGMKAAAEAIARAVGKEGIDYLLMTQNGVPDCNWVENEDGEAQPFAVQAQSRFVLPYLLIESSSLSEGATVLSICNTGQSLDTLEVDDLSLKKIRSSRSNLGYFMDQSKRDSTVIDSCVIEFASRYPQYRFCHIHPGLCKTEQFDFSMFPFPLNLAVRIGGWTFASIPDSFAPIPIYLTLNPDKLDTQLFDHQLKPVTAGLWAQNATNRSALWEKLLSMMK